LFENNEQSPSLFGKLPTEYINRLVPAITAFEIAVQSIENVFKLSQNRDEQSYINIIGKLMEGNEDAQVIAAEMKKRQVALYANKTIQNDAT
jgi:transcriptional regulator